jgi:adenylate cyclase
MPLSDRRTERRLAALVAADVVGSSRLMEQDEPGTLAVISDLMTGVVEPVATQHGGRLVKTLGDGALLEFASPVEAVLCAVEVQALLVERRRSEPVWHDINLRIGVNLGDIVVGPDGDVHGDSVNVAARLESIAEPDGICISEKVFGELEGKLSLPFEDRGEQRLKNIARPIRVYALKSDAASVQPPKAARLGQRRVDKPSIAVLPFTNLSGDSEQEYLAEGIADDILTALAKSRWLFVMARNSSFAFKGKAIETDEIARRLGVRYILSGSVRKSGSSIRVSAQLVDAESGESIWAERFDRSMIDLFALQDDIAEAVAGAIEPELLKKEGQRAAQNPQSLTAWDLVRRGVYEFNKFQPASHLAARDLFIQAIEIEPSSPDGYIWLARAETGLASYGWVADPEAFLRNAMAVSLKAAQLDERNPYSHYAVAVSHAFAGRFEPAIRAAQRALALSPTYALGHFVLGASYLLAGRPGDAVEPIEHALRLSPFDPQSFSWFEMLALAYYFSGSPEKGLEDAKRALVLRPGWPPALTVVALCSLKFGDHEQARSALDEIEPKGGVRSDLLSLILKYNPAWGEEIDAALAPR